MAYNQIKQAHWRKISLHRIIQGHTLWPTETNTPFTSPKPVKLASHRWTPQNHWWNDESWIPKKTRNVKTRKPLLSEWVVEWVSVMIDCLWGKQECEYGPKCRSDIDWLGKWESLWWWNEKGPAFFLSSSLRRMCGRSTEWEPMICGWVGEWKRNKWVRVLCREKRRERERNVTVPQWQVGHTLRVREWSTPSANEWLATEYSERHDPSESTITVLTRLTNESPNTRATLDSRMNRQTRRQLNNTWLTNESPNTKATQEHSSWCLEMTHTLPSYRRLQNTATDTAERRKHLHWITNLNLVQPSLLSVNEVLAKPFTVKCCTWSSVGERL